MRSDPEGVGAIQGLTMELTPVEFTGRALKILEEAVRQRLQALHRAASRSEVPDTKAVLSYLLDNLISLFPEEMPKRDARSYIHELISVRNKWAHSEPLDYDDAYRAADTVNRLCKLLGCEDPSADALRREIVGVF